MFKKLLSYIIPVNLYKTDSVISKSIEINLYNGELVMDSRNANYSYGSLQRVLRFGLKKIDFEKIREMQDILVLGLAGGSVVKTLVDEVNFTGSITGVDIDSEIIKIANTYFELDKIPNLRVIIDDAQKFVKQREQKYDLIIVDIFQDRNMPGFLFEKSFADDLKALLYKNGVILFNTMKTNPKDERRNTELKLHFSQQNIDIFVFSEIEKYNELIILKQKS